MNKMISTVGLLALAGCQHQEPAAAPPPADPAPLAGETPSATAPAPVSETKLPPATPDERAKWYQSCWALFNAKDWAKFQNCIAETATSEQVDSGFPLLTGRKDVVEKGAKNFVAQFPDVTAEHQLTLLSGNNVVSVVLFRGTNSGPLVSPMGTMPATNKKIGLLAAHVVETSEDGRLLAHDKFYLDASSMMGQLGVNPGPHRKLMEVGWAEKPVVLATGSETEKKNLADGQRAIDAFNKHDLNALMALWTDDGVFSDQASPMDSVGKAAIKKSYQELFKGFSDVKLDVSRVWAAGDYVVSEGTFSGTNNADVPSWKLKKTGKKVSVRFLEIDKLMGGKLKNTWIFDNGMAFAMQLGMGPPPPGGKPDAKAGKNAKAPAPTAAATPAAKPAAPATSAAPAAPKAAGPAAPKAAPAK